MTEKLGPGLIELRGWLRSTLLSVFIMGLFFTALGCSNAVAQFRPSYDHGKGVSPVYEGWIANEDGSFTMLFGYMNENWLEELNIPIGPDNSFSGTESDRGQPTHFLPRRNRTIFGVRIPADFGNQELVWTLISTDAVTQKAYGSLRRDYILEPITLMSESGTVAGGRDNGADVQTNQPPEITLHGSETRTIRIGESLHLAVTVEDDGKPNQRRYGRFAPAFSEEDTPQERLDKAIVPPIRGTVNRVVGLYFSWYLFRGDGEANFDPLQTKIWEDTRAFQNSPWSPHWIPPEPPEDGVWQAEVTFQQPGTYTLRGRADDGGLVNDVNVVIHVTQ